MSTSRQPPDLLSLMNDFVFKALFGREEDECRIMLTDFLNTVIYGPNQADRIKEIVYLNPFNPKEHQTDKLSVLDIKVMTAKGIRINVEVQVSNVDNYRKRSLYYWSRLYGEGISESDYYEVLKKAIIVNIIDFNLIQESTRYHTSFLIMEKDEHFVLMDDLEIHYLELGKYKTREDLESITGIELWLTFFKEVGSKPGLEKLKKIAERSETISMALKNLEKISADEVMRIKSLEREMSRRDEISRLKYAEEKGIKKGMEKGMEKGLENTLTALELFRQGKDLDYVREKTGLDQESLIKIQAQAQVR